MSYRGQARRISNRSPDKVSLSDIAGRRIYWVIVREGANWKIRKVTETVN